MAAKPTAAELLALWRALVTPAFDAAFYQAQVGATSIPDPVLHYLVEGWLGGADPSPAFSTAAYLERYPDVRQSRINPFVHYLQWGRVEGRVAAPSTRRPTPPTAATGIDRAAIERQRALLLPEFDAAFYQAQARDPAEAALDPVLHYLLLGWRERRDPSPGFSSRAYLERYVDVRDGGLNPLLHFLAFGRAEGRVARPSRFRSAALDQARHGRDADIVRDRFDATFYRRQVPDGVLSDAEALFHYLATGWRDRLDPSPDFSTGHYLDRNADVAASGLNPFAHWVAHGGREGRSALPFSRRKAHAAERPLVSVIVPNFNHARFLPQRIDSILAQTYRDCEIILLDDASSDGSQALIGRYRDAHPDRIRTVINAHNGGNVFLQWRRGLELARGSLVWICESDDFCEPSFLERAVEPLADPSVMISFGRVQYADQDGRPVDGLDHYRERAEPGIWGARTVRPAFEWFRGAFSATNVIPNVGGCVFRNQPVDEATWAEATRFRICGDWFLYLVLAQGGRIAYVPDAVAWFRQHGRNTSVIGRRQPHYYAEHEAILRHIRLRWAVPETVGERMRWNVHAEYQLAGGAAVLGAFDRLYDTARVTRVTRAVRHVLIATLGFQLGGAELFPIYLANALVGRGFLVSLLTIDGGAANPTVRALLDGRVAVYEQDLVREMGREAFLDQAGIDLVHSHNIGAEFLFFHEKPVRMRIPYVVTLHGSYEVTPIPDALMIGLLRNVSHWVYLTGRNLGHLDGIPIEPTRLSHIPNGVPADDRASVVSRGALGIGPHDLVFTIASRAVPEKGWRQAVAALRRLGTPDGRRIHLVLCGSGPEADDLKDDPALPPNVHVLGFQDRINGIYTWSDVVLLPTRFKGESFPLSVIQALQVGRPVIATDVGQIKGLIEAGGLSGGIAIPHHEQDDAFVTALAAAMTRMTDDAVRVACRDDAMRLGRSFDMDRVVAAYVDLYGSELRRPSRVPLSGPIESLDLSRVAEGTVKHHGSNVA